MNKIPGTTAFRDRLSAQSRTAGPVGKAAPLSVAVVRLYPSGTVSERGEDLVAFGDAVQSIHRRLRATDSIYSLSPGIFGVVLQSMDPMSALRFIASLELGLQDAAGVDARFTADVQLLNAADHGKSSQDLYQAVSSLLPRKLRSYNGWTEA